MVVRNQTTEQPAKLRLDGYGTILLDAHGVFLTDYQNLRKTPGFNYGECQRYSLFQQCRIYVMSLLHSSVISFCRVPGFRAEP